MKTRVVTTIGALRWALLCFIDACELSTPVSIEYTPADGDCAARVTLRSECDSNPCTCVREHVI